MAVHSIAGRVGCRRGLHIGVRRFEPSRQARRAIYYWAAENQRLCSASLILMLAININELGPSGRLQRQRAASHGQCVYVGSDACVVLLNDDIC